MNYFNLTKTIFVSTLLKLTFSIMRKLILFSVSIVFLVLGNGCKKCYRCTVLDEDASSIYEYPDICGSKSEYNSYEERCVTEYGAFDFTCSCAEI
jgi:hypothetical protein